MTRKDDGGPAFARAGGEMNYDAEGMSLRQYYAAHAPITCEEAYKCITDYTPFGSPGPTWEQVFNRLSAMRFEYADAMIAAGGNQ